MGVGGGACISSRVRRKGTRRLSGGLLGWRAAGGGRVCGGAKPKVVASGGGGPRSAERTSRCAHQAPGRRGRRPRRGGLAALRALTGVSLAQRARRRRGSLGIPICYYTLPHHIQCGTESAESDREPRDTQTSRRVSLASSFLASARPPARPFAPDSPCPARLGLRRILAPACAPPPAPFPLRATTQRQASRLGTYRTHPPHLMRCIHSPL